MTKVNTATATKPVEQAKANANPAMAVIKTEPGAQVKKEMTLDERIHRVESLQLLVSKRSKLLQTRMELERFQVGSNDFNCHLNLKDSDANVFATSFTPGIKKVIDFLKASFDTSIQEVENQIKF
jgi:hypothetical protein